MPRTLVVPGKARLAGSVEAPSSVYTALVLLALAALHGGSVSNLPRSPLLARARACFKRISASVEEVAAGKVEVEPVEAPTRRIVVSVGCSLHLLALAAAVAAVSLKPGSQVVFRGECSWMIKIVPRHLVEALAAMGAKAWPGGSLAALLVVEPAGRATRRGLWRLPGGAPGHVVAASIVAATALEEPVAISVAGPEWTASSRVAVAAEAARLAGAEVKVAPGGRVLVRPGRRRLSVKVPGGYAEAGYLAVAVLASGGWTEVRGLPASLGGEEVLVDLLRAWGPEASAKCLEGLCTLKARAPRGLEGFRGFTTSVTSTPQLVPILAAMAAASRASIAMGGVGSAASEGLSLEELGAVLSKLGVALDAREGCAEVLGAYAGRPPERVVVECREGSEQLCAMALSAGVGLGAEVRVLNAELLDNAVPGAAEKLLELGARVEEL